MGRDRQMSDVAGVVLELGRWALAGALAYVALWAATRPRQENEVWKELGIKNARGEYPHLLDKKEPDDSVTYTFWIPDGIDMSKMKAGNGGKPGKMHAMVAQAFAGLRQCDIVPLGINRLAIKVYEHRLGSMYRFDPAWISDGELLRIPIGQSLRGPEYLSLGDSSAHVLIGGTTGSGKSTCVNVITTYLAVHKAPAHLYLVDLKGGVELGGYERCRKVKAFAKTEADAAAMISGIVAEMNHRYELLAEAGVRNIRDYGGVMRRLVLIVDEYADLAHNKAVTEYLVQIALKGRAAGVHMALALQRPDMQTIDSRIKSCLTTVICFRVKLPQNSTVILGHGGAEHLRGDGHAIYDRGGREIEMQGYYMNDAMIEELIAPTLVEKTRPEQSDTSGVLS